ncbi:RagB/SusD family nutrient uptake outer membrane protein [Myroides marinus]|uniref:RagB/SusD family nutrient uptake outer membrane protein n=1 Tax=Myroides marinus TaxID=703342 RepID=UPI002578A342|nr:RagB/SusD family nutrient uptake outer membrane protein [Myroides marinus]MDM1352137.1 RagB/SusD family nutrient uptake outer membrane protein [Myroides marinus]MDM1359322.1 RagB/SusD family nutrient uptake outer membrane protein [Myroides marinus]MDM1363279.1 RagB/SusD family nutrient uptake outer membrane protein [Myroides marinus]MDM1370303.1 RagB/SusD family nutrient uptake outer membrane protein [Myroides marinus]MDM1373709.1 RagB/SusD family nutrient uptake outer membrane protein [Myr
MKAITLYIKPILLLILIILSSTSCESMIDVDSPNDQINKTAVFQDIVTAKSALTYLYSRMRDNSLIGKSTDGLSFSLSLYTGELEHYGNLSNDFYLNTIQASNSTVGKWWNQSYKDIYSINSFIEGITLSDKISLEDKKQLLGEAYILRAIFYQYLVQLFGDIPFTTTTDYTYNTSIGKTKSEKILLEIEKDLLSALENLDYSYRSMQKTNVNKAVAELLLAENYLLQKKYDKAQIYSQNILNSDLYSLEDDINKVFKKTAKSTIWQISPLLNTNITPEASYYISERLTSNSSAINQHLLDSFDTNDLRLKNWTKKLTQNQKEIFQVYKYKNYQNNPDEFSIFFRLEQVYLMLAESQIHQEKISEAISTLNKLRVKRGLNAISNSITKDNAIEILLQEYNKEFFTESGMRFFSLKRHNKLNKLIEIKTNWKEFYQLFPIHEKQLQINKNLLPNNPGY